MTTLEEVSNRLSKLEGAYEHLATKEDVAKLEVRLAQMETRIVQVEGGIAQAETRIVKWMIGLMVSSVAVASAVALLITRLWG